MIFSQLDLNDSVNARVAILSGHFGSRRPKVQGPQDPRALAAQVASLI